MTSHQNESNLSLFLFVYFVISLQNWNHFPFPAKSSPPSFFYVKQLSQTNKNQFIESSPCPTIGTAQKRNLHIFGPKTHGCKEGGPPFLNGSLWEAQAPPNKNCLVVEPPHPSEKICAARHIGSASQIGNLSSTIFGRNIPKNIRVATGHIEFHLSEGVKGWLIWNHQWTLGKTQMQKTETCSPATMRWSSFRWITTLFFEKGSWSLLHIWKGRKPSFPVVFQGEQRSTKKNWVTFRFYHKYHIPL